MFNLAIIKKEVINLINDCRPGAYIFYIADIKDYHKSVKDYEKQGFIVKDCIFYADNEVYLIAMLQKPLYKTYVDNTLEYGCGGLNIDKTRIATDENITTHSNGNRNMYGGNSLLKSKTHTTGQQSKGQELGRFPANFIIHKDIAPILDKQSGIRKSGYMNSEIHTRTSTGSKNGIYGKYNIPEKFETYGDSGGASRFFKNTENLVDLYSYLLDLGLQPFDNKIFTNIREVTNLVKEKVID